MYKITEDKAKMELVSKLVASKYITFEEALLLLRVEIEQVKVPVYNPVHTRSTSGGYTNEGDMKFSVKTNY